MRVTVRVGGFAFVSVGLAVTVGVGLQPVPNCDGMQGSLLPGSASSLTPSPSVSVSEDSR